MIMLEFIYSEKATKFCEIFPLLLSAVHTVKSKGKISQNFVAFSEYMNFKENLLACFLSIMQLLLFSISHETSTMKGFFSQKQWICIKSADVTSKHFFSCIWKKVSRLSFFSLVKFIYSEKATKFYKISTLLLTGTT